MSDVKFIIDSKDNETLKQAVDKLDAHNKQIIERMNFIHKQIENINKESEAIGELLWKEVISELKRLNKIDQNYQKGQDWSLMFNEEKQILMRKQHGLHHLFGMLP